MWYSRHKFELYFKIQYIESSMTNLPFPFPLFLVPSNLCDPAFYLISLPPFCPYSIPFFIISAVLSFPNTDLIMPLPCLKFPNDTQFPGK